MAQVPSTFSVEFVDAYGIPATTLINVEVDDSKTVAQLRTDIATWLTDIARLSQGVAVKTRFQMVEETGFDTSTAAGDVEKGALFNFSNATDSYAYGVWIPDVNPSILTTAGLVDLTNTDVTTFISLLTTAGTVITAVTKGVRALAGLIDALISFRKHRKPLERKTKEL